MVYVNKAGIESQWPSIEKREDLDFWRGLRSESYIVIGFLVTISLLSARLEPLILGLPFAMFVPVAMFKIHRIKKRKVD